METQTKPGTGQRDLSHVNSHAGGIWLISSQQREELQKLILLGSKQLHLMATSRIMGRLWRVSLIVENVAKSNITPSLLAGNFHGTQHLNDSPPSLDPTPEDARAVVCDRAAEHSSGESGFGLCLCHLMCQARSPDPQRIGLLGFHTVLPPPPHPGMTAQAALRSERVHASLYGQEVRQAQLSPRTLSAAL